MVKTYTLIAQIGSGTIQTSSTGKHFTPWACKQNTDINIETLNFNELLLHLATQFNCGISEIVGFGEEGWSFKNKMALEKKWKYVAYRRKLGSEISFPEEWN